MEIVINGKTVEAQSEDTILKAALRADIYIPTLCYHPDLPPRKGAMPVQGIFRGETRIENCADKTPADGISSGCGLCVVQRADTGELIPSCLTSVAPGVEILTETEPVKTRRQEKLAEILAYHPHACLTCAQHEGCSRTQCSSNVPENERCCPRFGNCELQRVSEYVGISPSTAKWLPTNIPILDQEPLLARNYNLCISCTRCVRACRDLRGIEAIGFVFDEQGRVTVGSMAQGLKDSGCKFCTACVEVCPTGAILDKGIRPQDREKELLPCVAACPAGINIPWYLRFLSEGKADEAHSLIRERVPFTGILGRVCVRPCESACRRAQVNEAISICALKRFAADNETGSWKAAFSMPPETGKKIAVIGSGPAGLTAAFYLRKKGHGVTVFDSAKKPGGMMRYGIPRYRLPEDVLDREIGEIFALGVDFRPKAAVGKDLSLARIRSDYDAVFVATGAPLSRKIPLDGLDLPQALWGVDFLREIGEAVETKLSGKVVVIGGGAVAIDVAMTARRVGAEDIHLVCLEDKHEMPAHGWEIRDAEEEGVNIHNGWGPLEIVEQQAGVRGICFKKCVRVLDESGRFNPSYDDECTMGLDADTVILAIGQTSDLDFVSSEGVQMENRLIKVDEKSSETSVAGVFAGGDAAVFPGAIVQAVAAGRKAAESIDAYLGGNGVIAESLVQLPPLNPRIGRDEGFAYRERLGTTKIPVAERTGFQEVDLGLAAGDACLEARRCLQCDLRLALGAVPAPPEHLFTFTRENVEKAPDSEGAFRLMDETQRPVLIKGSVNMRALLLEYLDEYQLAKFFDYEEDKMYSKRESELVQQHLQKYGEMPGFGGDEDDLF